MTLLVLDNYSDILLEGELEEYYWDVKLYDLQGGEIACQKYFYKTFVKYLKDAHLEYIADGYTFTISSDKLVRFVKLSLPMEGHFSKNYFDLDGGASKRVEFYPRNKAEVLIGDLKIESMKDHL